jgi:acyl carrier protein
MNKAAFLNEMETILQAEPKTLTGGESLDQFWSWDSMAKLLFITLADESFGMTLQPKGITACKTIDDLFDLASNGNAH